MQVTPRDSQKLYFVCILISSSKNVYLSKFRLSRTSSVLFQTTSISISIGCSHFLYASIFDKFFLTSVKPVINPMLTETTMSKLLLIYTSQFALKIT